MNRHDHSGVDRGEPDGASPGTGHGEPGGASPGTDHGEPGGASRRKGHAAPGGASQREGSPPVAPPLGAAPAPAEPGPAFAPASKRPDALALLAERAAVVAVVAGVLGLFSGPFMMAGSSRYLILLFAAVALTAGALGLWGALRHRARLDYAVAGMIMGAAGLYLWIDYVIDPPQGGT
jgi:hypothetical protein